MQLTNASICNTFDYYCLTFYDVDQKCFFFARGINSSRETINVPPTDLILPEQYNTFIKSVAEGLKIIATPSPSLGKTIRSISYVGTDIFITDFQIVGLNLKDKYFEVLQEFETSKDLRRYHNSLSSE